MLCTMEFGVFFMFAGFVVLMTFFVYFFVPETKGVPVEEMDTIMVRRHWFWSKVVSGTDPIEADPIPVAVIKSNLSSPASEVTNRV